MRLTIITLLLLFSLNTIAKSKRELTLESVVDTLVFTSANVKMAYLQYGNVILQYENYKKSFLPSFSLSLQPVSFNHSLRLLQNYSDGSYSNVEDYTNTSSVGLNIKQKIAPTGGELYANSSLSYLREFSQNRNDFSSTPFSLGYSQPFFGGRKTYRYEKRINQATYENAVKQYYNSVAMAQSEVANLFLGTQIAANQLAVSKQIQDRNDSLLQISKLKLQNELITEYDYKQLELQSVTLRYDVEAAQNSYETALKKLETYLGLNGEIKIAEESFNLPNSIDSEAVLTNARLNNPFYEAQDIDKLSAEQELYQTKLSNKINGNINLSFGMNNYANTFLDAYKRGNSSQTISVGVTVPVFQWGISKNKVKIAENNYTEKCLSINKGIADYERKVSEYVLNYNHLVNIYFASKQARDLAMEQFQLALLRFELGKLSLYELRNVQREQDEAVLKCSQALQQVYETYFLLRKEAMYDFVHQQTLQQRYKLKN